MSSDRSNNLWCPGSVQVKRPMGCEEMQNTIHLLLMRRSKKADESSIQSYSSKSSSIASSLKSVSQAVEKSVDVLTRPLKRVKTVLLSKKTRSSSSSPEPSVIDVDVIDTAM